jgi:hypothetical protein
MSKQGGGKSIELCGIQERHCPMEDVMKYDVKYIRVDLQPPRNRRMDWLQMGWEDMKRG